jgi:hypothetical protein
MNKKLKYKFLFFNKASNKILVGHIIKKDKKIPKVAKKFGS